MELYRVITDASSYPYFINCFYCDLLNLKWTCESKKLFRAPFMSDMLIASTNELPLALPPPLLE